MIIGMASGYLVEVEIQAPAAYGVCYVRDTQLNPPVCALIPEQPLTDEGGNFSAIWQGRIKVTPPNVAVADFYGCTAGDILLFKCVVDENLLVKV
jgi:hypothetical protein